MEKHINNNVLISLKELGIGMSIFFIIAIPFFRNLESHSFHGDENYWLRSSKYFELFLIDRNLNNEKWNKCKEPPVGKYIIGMALHIAGYGDRIEELSRMKRWKFLKGHNWNVNKGRMPPKEPLYVARLTMALFGTLTCLLIYWIGRILWGVKVGIIASLLLAYNPLMLLCSKRAMTDALLLFFMTSTILLIIYFYRFLVQKKFLRTIVCAVLIGITCGLATGTKLNGGLTGLIFACFCVLCLLIKGVHYTFSNSIQRSTGVPFKKDRELRIILMSLFISGVTAILIFAGTNPCLYRQPLKGSVNMINRRMVLNQWAQQYWPPIKSITQKADFVVKRTFFPKNYVVLGTIVSFPIDLVLFTLGLLLLLYTEGKYLFENWKPSFRSIIIIWTFITFIGVISWIPFDWHRYYLPVIPCIVIMTGYCLNSFIDKTWFLGNRFYGTIDWK